MKKLIVVIFVIFCFISSISIPKVYASEGDKIYLLGNSSFEQVLDQNNMYKKFHIASITKLMTAYICYNYIENKNISFNNEVLISKKASDVEPSKAYLIEGNKYKLKDLFDVMLIKSANDCAIAIAEHICGSEEKFSELMNLTAKELNMKSSHYTNASGLSTPNQYSTAYDQYLLFLEILKIDYIVDILKQQKIDFNNGEVNKTFYATNTLINSNIIGKTGYTLESKNCFCGCNINEEKGFVYITFNHDSSENRFLDVKKSILNAKQDYNVVNLVNTEECIKQLPLAENILRYKSNENFNVYVKENSKNTFSVIKKFSHNYSLPIKNGDKVGEYIVIQNNRVIKRIDIFAQNSVKRVSIFTNIKRIIAT